MPDRSDTRSPAPDARRPGPRNRLRRLVHPHRRTVARVVVGTVITIAALAIVGGAIRSLRADGRPPIEPDVVDQLRADRIVDLGAGPVAGLAGDDGTLLVTTDEGLTQLDLACTPATATATGAATPTAPSGSMPGEAEPGAKHCEVTWRVFVRDGPLSAPVVADGLVFASSSSGRVYAFDTDCPTPICEPAWAGLAGEGIVSQPAVNDDFVYVLSDRLYAFPSGCGTDDRICSPAWSATIPGASAPAPPAIGEGLVVVTSSAAGGSLYAFPAVCSARCQPVWTATTSGTPGGVAVRGGTAYVVAGRRLLAFPLSCRGRCEASWSGTFGAPDAVRTEATGPPVAGGDLVYVAAQDGSLWVFSAACDRSTCEPVRSHAIAEGPVWGPVVQAGVAYSTGADGTLNALVDDCGSAEDACGTPWSVVLSAPTEVAPALGPGVVYAGDDEGQVYAFALPPS